MDMAEVQLKVREGLLQHLQENDLLTADREGLVGDAVRDLPMMAKALRESHTFLRLRLFRSDKRLRFVAGLMQAGFWARLGREQGVEGLPTTTQDTALWDDIRAAVLRDGKVPDVYPMEFVRHTGDDFREFFREKVRNERGPEAGLGENLEALLADVIESTGDEPIPPWNTQTQFVVW